MMIKQLVLASLAAQTAAWDFGFPFTSHTDVQQDFSCSVAGAGGKYDFRDRRRQIFNRGCLDWSQRMKEELWNKRRVVLLHQSVLSAVWI